MTCKRRLAAAVLATALATSFGIEASFAQGATVGPAGGTPSTTARSNSEGTPSGGTGTVGSSTVSPGRATASTAPRRTTRPVRHRTSRPRQAPAATDSSQ